MLKLKALNTFYTRYKKRPSKYVLRVFQYLNQNEDVIDSDCENEEGNDLEDDERGRNSGESEDSDGGGHRQQDDHDTAKAQRHLTFNLRTEVIIIAKIRSDCPKINDHQKKLS